MTAFLLMASLLLFVPVSVYGNESVFPPDEVLRSRVDFWKKVYSEATSDEGFLHDDTDLSIIYIKLNVPNERSRTVKRMVNAQKDEVRNVLQDLIDGTEVDASVYPWVEKLKDASKEQLRRYKSQVRWQRGLSDRFLEGIKRSNIYLEHIKKVFIEEGVPVELSYLPHVESSFQYQAYSKVGAAGIWQFMRSTAKQYKLKINYVYDERLDPLICAHAAAKLLKNNYQRLRSWPLALTAYNHGVYGIERAVRETGSSRLQDINKVYRGRRFGFASQNFYASFVAAYELAQAPENHFGKFEYDEPINYFEIKLPKEIAIATLIKATQIEENKFRFYNRAIRPNAYRLNLTLSKGFPLKLPKRLQEKEATILAEIKKYIQTVEPITQRISGVHQVIRGETLYDIAKQYRIPLGDLVAFNKINDPGLIIPGTKLKIPDQKEIQSLHSDVEETSAETIEKFNVDPIISQINNFELPHLSFSEVVENTIIRNEMVTTDKQDYVPLPDDITKTYNLKILSMSDSVFRIRVEIDETLGHFADWALVSASKIRRLNDMGMRHSLKLGQILDIPINKDNVSRFNSKRIEFHTSIEEDFFENYRVVGFAEHTVKRNESLHQILNDYQIPLWLFRKYQLDHSTKIFKGQVLKLPTIEALHSEAQALNP